MNDKTRDLITAYQENRLIDAAYNLSLGGEENWSVTGKLLSELHNKGDIDILKSYLSLRNYKRNCPEFSASLLFFDNVLPTLDASVKQVMLCVKHLVNEAGSDVAVRIYGSFIKFLLTSHMKPRQALDVIRPSPAEWHGFICPTITVGARINPEKYLGHAIELTSHEIPEVGINAIRSLGCISYQWPSPLPKRAIEEIVRISEEKHNDEYMAAVVEAASSLAKLDASLVDSVYGAISNALRKGSDKVLHATTWVFGFKANDIPHEILHLIISFFPRVKAKNKESIDNIDCILGTLFKQDRVQAIKCMEEILIQNADTLSINAFDNFIFEVQSGDLDTLNYMLTRWFIKGDRVLCMAIEEIIGKHGYEPPLKVHLETLPNTNRATFTFLARKAIGYLLLKPVSVSSIIISLLRNTKDQGLMSMLGDLLLNLVLLDYPGSVKKFLESRQSKEPEHVKEVIESVLSRLELYLEKIRGIGEIPELWPALKQREAYMRNFSRQVLESYEEANKDSVFSSIFTEQVILYGRSATIYVGQPHSTSSRMEVPMQEHSVEMEFPGRYNFDPFGMDYTRRVFRGERLREYEADN